MSVSVWDHVPDADEILQARVDEGWQPTPSSLCGGDQVLGHAARLVDRRESVEPV
jgi:hypothetical protein